MHDLIVKNQRLQNGVWTCDITGVPGAQAPDVQVLLQGTLQRDMTLTKTGLGDWILSVPVPAAAIADGAQTLLLVDRANLKVLAHLSLLAGEAAEQDLRATVDLLRAELDLIKRAFRDHCRRDDGL